MTERDDQEQNLQSSEKTSEMSVKADERSSAATVTEAEENQKLSLEQFESLKSEVQKKQDECQVLNDKYLRLAAEFENYKRRSQRDQQDTVRYANEKLLKELLPTLDNLERAIKCGREKIASDAFLEGVELTYKQFLDCLTKMGVSQISSLGDLFDPAKHQAVSKIESNEVAPNTVLEELQKGYFLNDRILRPAMVTVAMAQAQQESGLTGPEEGGNKA